MKMEELKEILKKRIVEAIDGKKTNTNRNRELQKNYYDGRRAVFQLILDEIELAEKMEKEGG